jgi:hypothetical protein
MRSGLVQEFRPVAVPGTARVVIGVVMLVVVGAATLLLASVVWLPREMRYEITADTLVVKLRAGFWRDGRVVPLTAITAAKPVELGRGRRVVGSSMPGYCVGRFSYAGLGSVWQATSCGRSVVEVDARSETVPVLVEPADRDGFLAALAAREPGRWAPASFPREGGWIWVKLLLLTPLLVIPFLVLTFFVAPGRLRYEVGQGELVVRTMLGARRFPLSSTSARACTAGRSFKVAGSGMPGYFTGWYVVDGRRTSVYATRLSDGVLIEGTRRVFVTPAEAGPFIEALRANGATLG